MAAHLALLIACRRPRLRRAIAILERDRLGARLLFFRRIDSRRPPVMGVGRLTLSLN